MGGAGSDAMGSEAIGVTDDMSAGAERGVICPGRVCPEGGCPDVPCPGRVCPEGDCPDAPCPGGVCPEGGCPGRVCPEGGWPCPFCGGEGGDPADGRPVPPTMTLRDEGLPPSASWSFSSPVPTRMLVAPLPRNASTVPSVASALMCICMRATTTVVARGWEELTASILMKPSSGEKSLLPGVGWSKLDASVIVSPCLHVADRQCAGIAHDEIHVERIARLERRGVPFFGGIGEERSAPSVGERHGSFDVGQGAAEHGFLFLGVAMRAQFQCRGCLRVCAGNAAERRREHHGRSDRGDAPARGRCRRLTVRPACGESEVHHRW